MHALKVGLVLDDSLDSTDGVQQYVLTVGAWLTSQGHEVHYLVGKTTRTDLPNIHSLSRNIRVRYNGNRLSIPLPASKRRLRQVLRTEQFDVLHVQTPYSPLLAGRLLHLVDEKTAVIGSFHVLPYTRTIAFVNRLLAMLNRRTAKRFDIMLANTEPTRSFAEHVYGFDARIVPNPFPYKSFVVEPPETTGAARIVFLGRLVPRKGAQALLRAIAYLRREHLSTAPFKVVIGGKGPERESLESYVQQQGLGDIVTFAGFVAEIDKADFLAAADIAVFPSIAGESFGISLLEAMAAARGVVLGGDNPGYRAVLAPLSEAQLILPDDETAFATALAHWLDEPKLRAAAAQAQKAYVRQFDIEVVGKQLIETYDEALRSRRNVR